MIDANSLYVGEVKLKKRPEEDEYLNSLPVVKHLASEELSFSKPVTFFMGENGTGKSTLLEAIAVAYGFNAEGGTRNFTFSTRQTHSELSDCISITKYGYPKDGFFLRAESFYNLATDIDVDSESHYMGSPIIGAYGGVSLHEQSHGESFFAVIKNRFRGKGLYILDEPEAALSPMRLMSLLVIIDELVKDDSQFIISTHSPILAAYPDSEILELTPKGIASVSLRETEHYKITRQFIDAPEKMLHYLLD
ncbi:MAG: AAA family ATPase [Oscillospiraceae bacterium]|nr:AAA family ATPase [Oscillospiraceae bacterium]